MIKKIIFIFLIFLSLTNVTNASQKYKYICDDNKCYNTINDNVSDNIYYMSNVTQISTDNFSNFIDSKFSYYSNLYDGINYQVKGYCEGSCDSIENRDFTLKDLYNYNTSFSIGKSSFFSGITVLKTYDNGKDYIFDNFTFVIDTLYKSLSVGDKKDKLSDLFSNILYYNNTSNRFSIKNICVTSTCKESNLSSIKTDSSSYFVFLDGDIKYYDSFKTDTFKVSSNYNISPLLIKAGSGVVFDFGFEDYLDQFIDKTEYEYKIYYNYEGDGKPSIDDTPLFEEIIYIDGNNFEVTGAKLNAKDIAQIINLKVDDIENKKIRLGIKEGIILTKAGKVNFYLSVKNKTSGDSFPITKVNLTPLLVLPADDITNANSSIEYPVFTPEQNSESKGYTIAQPFRVRVQLFDSYDNIQTDNIDGYDITLSDGSSSEIVMSTSKDGIFSGKLTGVKSSGEFLEFYFKIPKPGYHKINGFDIKYTKKESLTKYFNPIKEGIIKNVIPSNLYDGNKLMSVYIQIPETSELNLKCGQVVKVNFDCISDNFSGCNFDKNTNKIYTSETENHSKGTLTISDYAYMVRSYTYTMNHVDRTAPIITIKKGTSSSNELEAGKSYSYKANDDQLNIDFYEWTTSLCDAKVTYDIKVNGVTLKNGSKTGQNSSIILDDLFKKSGNYNIEVNVKDNYGNSNSKNFNLVIYPDIVDINKSSVSLLDGLSNTKYGNFYDKYNYKLTLKDKFSNPIYDKDVVTSNLTCDGINGCNLLKTIPNGSVNAIVENFINNINKTDSNGNVKVSLKSYVPGLFREIFEISINTWDNSYIDNGPIKSYVIGNYSNTNNFLIPIKADISILEGGSTPEIGIMQKYSILLNDVSLNLKSYTNGILNITENTIKDKVEGHFWNKFVLLNKVFNDNLGKYLGFSGSLDANDNILTGVDLSSDKIDISYNIGGKPVKYSLEDFGIKGCNVSTLGLKIIGNLQGDGKSSVTGQDANFSDISKSELRSQIRLNGFKLVKSMKNGQIIGKVKYVEGDIDISLDNDLSKYETLVVYNGNVIVSNDLNTSGKKLGIIVLKNNYITNIDYNKSGNVYVNNNVENINAIIYADGGFFSAKSDGTRYNDLDLDKVLTLNGSLFTRNTIGGAVRGNSNYTLPGGKITTDYNLAETYDLNYIRKVDNQCDPINNYSFLIKYDSKIQLNPPIGFSN